MISSVYVANNILKKGLENDVDVTPLKLQKLVYFVYKAYLKKTGRELFSEPFETWTHGPVAPSIYVEFNSYGDRPIKSFASDSQGRCYIVTETGCFKECLDKVWDEYSEYSGTSLSEFTHQKGMAWTKAKEKGQRYLDVGDIKNEPEPQKN